MSLEAPRARARAGTIRSPHDLAGGLFLIGLAAAGLAGGFNLPFGRLSGIGSGLLPRVVAILVAGFGILLLLQGVFLRGDRLERWHLRGPVFVLGGVLVFALTIRGASLSLAGYNFVMPPLGLAIAGPLAVIISALADKDTRFIEVIPYALLLTALSIGLFKILLRLPIPIFPPGYGPF